MNLYDKPKNSEIEKSYGVHTNAPTTPQLNIVCSSYGVTKAIGRPPYGDDFS